MILGALGSEWNYLIVLLFIVLAINLAALITVIAGGIYAWWIDRYEVTHVTPDLKLVDRED